MGDAMAEKYMAERDQQMKRIEMVKDAAIDANRDLSDQDLSIIQAAHERVEKLNKMLKVVSVDLQLDDDVLDSLAKLQPGVVKPRTVSYRSAGELMWDMLHAHADREALDRYNKYTTRAAQHMGTTEENTTPTAGGMPGLMVTGTAGVVLDLKPQGRPLLTALGVQPAPAYQFTRPRIVDAGLDTGVAIQALEKGELASVKFDVKGDPLTLVTVGGYLNVSEQLIEMVPGSLDIIIAQMNKRLNRYTEFAALAEIVQSTAEVTLADGASLALTVKAFADASALVFENTGELATWVAMGPLGWARLAALTDTAGRPAFPFIGAANALGTTDLSTFEMSGPMGLRPVVTYGITDNTFWVGNSAGLEAYERRFPLLQAVEPSVLGRQIAVGSALAFYRPVTAEATATPTPEESNGVVHIGP